MIDAFATVFGTLMQLGILLFFIYFGVILGSSLIKRLRKEPVTLFKLIFVVFTPFVLGFAVPYLIQKEIEVPDLLSVFIGLAVFAGAHNFLHKIDVRFKDDVID